MSYESRLLSLDRQWDDALEELNQRRAARLTADAKSHDLANSFAASSATAATPTSPKRTTPLPASSSSTQLRYSVPPQLSSRSALRPSANSTSPSEHELSRALQQVNVAFDRVNGAATTPSSPLHPAVVHPPPVYLQSHPEQYHLHQPPLQQLQMRVHTPHERQPSHHISFSSTARDSHRHPHQDVATPNTTAGGRSGGGVNPST